MRRHITVAQARRQAEGLTQQMLADECGVSRILVDKIEGGLFTCGPKARRIAERLGVEVESLARPVIVPRRAHGRAAAFAEQRRRNEAAEAVA
jgi:transcriptional regulator with XRE-family HTH domain